MSQKKSNKKLNNWIERPSSPIMIDSFDGDMQKAVLFYSAEVDRLFLANYLLQTQLRATQQERRDLISQIQQMQRNQRNSQQQQKRRRHRRCAKQITRQYQCQAPRCGKSYGSQGSLCQHMRLKHPEMMVQEYNQIKKQEVKVLKKQTKKQNKRANIFQQQNNNQNLDEIQQENQNMDIQEFD